MGYRDTVPQLNKQLINRKFGKMRKVRKVVRSKNSKSRKNRTVFSGDHGSVAVVITKIVVDEDDVALGRVGPRIGAVDH
jgi:hypothetical protein